MCIDIMCVYIHMCVHKCEYIYKSLKCSIGTIQILSICVRACQYDYIRIYTHAHQHTYQHICTGQNIHAY